MGIFRLLLAISVVIDHSSPILGFELVGGQVAVQAFYIISGFYMALILQEKYVGTHNSYRLFIINRLLRLFPIYWLVWILTIIASVGIGIYTHDQFIGKLQPYADHGHHLSIGNLFFLFTTNLIIFFQDVVIFLGLDTGTGQIIFAPHLDETEYPLYRFLLIPQAWTLAIEMMFYIIAPFLVKKKQWVIFALITCSLLLRLILFKNGLAHDPWTHRFFPTELVFFLAGMVGYRSYKFIGIKNLPAIYLKVILGGIITFTLIYGFWDFWGKIYLYLLAVAFAIPFVFALTKNWKKDRYIGELSYPLYICHVTIAMVLSLFDVPIIGNGSIGLLVVSLLFSVLLHEGVAKRIDAFRQGRVVKEG